MTDKEIIETLETECCADCSCHPLSAVKCENMDCKYRMAITACVAMLRKRISDRTPFE